ncbi:MAG: TRAP transporter small permease [Salipiger thiooxidans]|jgi:TRAP-type C4-dicarboxylate transport system permease small subunit|uniref:TRAP transporter small permease n=1 Tax=Salipiger thiooxidans TaxID=282683 RepID=UPI001A8EA4B7|nr:TRAP transporter small permease [Salipiger thiooxidans]MBN8188652.1 TRAP transporter small permease [Salipiger thiooxidans]MBR9839353.1 TRAP transporter small permease [Paracoccaceae bacterium]MCA0849403.1 TRAP transporter small permease [Salipiger thiooxidans]
MIRKCMAVVDHAFTAVAVFALAFMTLLIVADVALRYGAGTPIFFAHDLVVLYLTPAVFFFGFGPTYWRAEHLSVDLLTLNLPHRLRELTDVVSSAIGLWVFGLLTWVAWERAAKSFANNEVIASIVPWPAWASYALVPIGSAAMVLVCAARIVISLNNAFGRATGEAAQ